MTVTPAQNNFPHAPTSFKATTILIKTNVSPVVKRRVVKTVNN